MSMIIDSYRHTSVASSLTDAILSLGPLRYFRHSEPSGTTMVDQIGANGSYNSASINQPAIYPGGPTCLLTSGSGSYGLFSGLPASLTSFSIFTIKKPTNLTGLHGIVCYDDGTSNRKWQWRTSNLIMQFVKIPGSVQTVSTAGNVMTLNQANTLGLTVSAAGAVNMYVNGTNVFSGSVTGTDYGGAAGGAQVGYCAGGVMTGDGNYSETALFTSVLTGTDFSNLHAASGL